MNIGAGLVGVAKFGGGVALGMAASAAIVNAVPKQDWPFNACIAATLIGGGIWWYKTGSPIAAGVCLAFPVVLGGVSALWIGAGLIHEARS
jgi:hypothetical protein